MILYQIISKEEDHMTCNTFKDGEALFTEPIDSRLNLQLPKSFYGLKYQNQHVHLSFE